MGEIKHISLDGIELAVTVYGDVLLPISLTEYKLLPKYIRRGYEYVEVRCNGKRKKFSVHRLVAQAFCENPQNKQQVNHIDGDTTNNWASNLEWVDSSENQYHSRYVLGNQTGFKDRPVVCVDTGETYISTRDAWRKTGVNYCHICECAKGKRKRAGGMRWEYAPLG